MRSRSRALFVGIGAKLVGRLQLKIRKTQPIDIGHTFTWTKFICKFVPVLHILVGAELGPVFRFLDQKKTGSATLLATMIHLVDTAGNAQPGPQRAILDVQL